MFRSPTLAASIAALVMSVSVVAQYGNPHRGEIEASGSGAPNYDPATGEPYLTQAELASLMREQSTPQRGSSAYGSASQAIPHRSGASNGRGLHPAPSYHHEREHHQNYQDQNSYNPEHGYQANTGYGGPSSSASQSYAGFGRPNAHSSSSESYDDDSSNGPSNNDEEGAGLYGSQHSSSGSRAYDRGTLNDESSDADGDDDNSASMGMSLKQAASHQGTNGYQTEGRTGGRSERDGPLNGFGDTVDGFAGPGPDADMSAMMREKAESSPAHDEMGDDDSDAAPRQHNGGYQHDGSAPAVNVRNVPTHASSLPRYNKQHHDSSTGNHNSQDANNNQGANQGNDDDNEDD